MATPRRRSARLRDSNTESPFRTFATRAATKLSSLLERDETPRIERSIDAMIATPSSKNTAMPGAFHVDESLLRTPEAAAPPKPGIKEMHPSKVQQSTANARDTGLLLGFADIGTHQSSPLGPLTRAAQSSPVKRYEVASSPGFDFKFNRPGTDLSAEAQRIMESVREEAARIKAKMKAEQEEQAQKDEEADYVSSVSGRHFATPKRKTGRFSDAHREQFQRMDSIVNHASTWKTKFQSGNTSLKRTASKVDIHSSAKNKTARDHSDDRLENTAPGKRMKKNLNDDVSAARPVSRAGLSSGLLSPTKLPSGVTTPTKASLARAQSVKAMRSISKIPALPRSRSTKALSSPIASKFAENGKLTSSIARLGNVRSILYRPQPKYSDDPIKIAAGTHLPIPISKLDVDKNLDGLPSTPYRGLQRSPTLKRVGFTSSTKDEKDGFPSSPSPCKIQTAPFSHLPPISPTKAPGSIAYPALLTRPTASPKISATDLREFTFRSDRPTTFGPSFSALNSPSTIRHVRPSGLPTPITTSTALNDLPSVPHGIANKKRARMDDTSDEENRPPGRREIREEGPQAKRVKTAAGGRGKSVEPASGVKRRMTGIGARAAATKGKGLSLGRLNMLARPKERK